MKRLLLLLVLLLICAAPSFAVSREVLPNGLRVLVLPNSSTDVMTATVLMSIPVTVDPPDQLGLRALTQRLLLRGTTKQTGDEMGTRLAAVGGSVSVNCALDYTEITVRAPVEGFDVAMELLAEALQAPAFLPEEVEGEKGRLKTSIISAQETPFQRTYQALREQLYGEAGYSRWVLGEASDLKAMSREDVVEFYRKYYHPEAAVLAISGGVEPERAQKVARTRFGGWAQAEEKPEFEAVKAAPLTTSDMVARSLPTTRTYLVFGFPAPKVGDSAYYTLQVIDSLLSGGSTARLPKALREDAGLVYEIASFYPTLAEESHFGIYAVTDDGCVSDVKKCVLEQLERLRNEKVPVQELERAKRSLLGLYALSQQDSRSQAYSAAWYELLCCPPDFRSVYQQKVNAVTAEDVQETAKTLIHHFILALTAPSL